MRSTLDRRRLLLGKLAHKLAGQAPAARLAQQRQRFKSVAERLPLVALNRRRLGEQALTPLAQRLRRAMEVRITLARRDSAKNRSDLTKTTARLVPAFTAAVARQRSRFSALEKLLTSLSYKRVLARGYAVVRQGETIVSRRGALDPKAPVTLEFHDGSVALEAGGEASTAIAPARPTKAKPTGGGQGSLF